MPIYRATIKKKATVKKTVFSEADFMIAADSEAEAKEAMEAVIDNDELTDKGSWKNIDSDEHEESDQEYEVDDIDRDDTFSEAQVDFWANEYLEDESK